MKTFPKNVALPLAAMLVYGLTTLGCERQAPAHPPARVPEVTTVTVQLREVLLTTELPGRTSAYRVAEIRPQVNGIIQKRLFTEGADVKAGAVLYLIDPAPFQAARDNAEAQLTAARKGVDQARAALAASQADVARLQETLDLARRNQARYEASFKEKVVSTIQRDQAVTEARVAASALRAAEAVVESNRQAVDARGAAIQQAEAALKTARINLGYCRVTAPISGRIGRSNVTEGAVVTAYQPVALATIQQLDPIFVDFPQATTELLRLRRSGLDTEGQDQNQVQLTLADGTPYPQAGALQFSDVSVDPTTGSVILRAVFPNPENLLLPGMFVQGTVKEGVKAKAILIPQQGVSRNSKGDPMALVVNAESKVGLRMLTLDRAIGADWLVTEGLAPGDRVIVAGLKMLRPGATVKAVDATAIGADATSAAASESPQPPKAE